MESGAAVDGIGGDGSMSEYVSKPKRPTWADVIICSLLAYLAGVVTVGCLLYSNVR